MNTIDLQIHTVASDGKSTPKEVVLMAKENGLETIAITDHDSVDGIEKAMETAKPLGIKVLPGIEFSVEEHGVHILGYGIDYKASKLLTELEKFQQGRIEGAKKMVENLKNSGFVIEWEDVLREASGGVVARPHISRAVVNRPENKEKLGGVSTVHDFIENFLSDQSPNYVKRSHISAREAISLINDSGGVAVWSHPAIHFPGDYEGLERFLQDLTSWNLVGVEVFNPSHTEDDAEFLNSLVVKYKLLRTSGSDFHEKGLTKKGVGTERGFWSLRSAVTVGDYQTYGFDTSDVVPKLEEAIEKQKQRVF